MRPAHEVINQLQHDARFDVGDFRVVWVDRHTGSHEESLRTLLVREDLPWHRLRAILYAPRDIHGEIPARRTVWSRDDGVDDVLAVVDLRAAPSTTVTTF